VLPRLATGLEPGPRAGARQFWHCSAYRPQAPHRNITWWRGRARPAPSWGTVPPEC